MTVAVKICGLTDADSVEAAIKGGADFLGFVFFDASPRHVAVEQAADLIEAVPETVPCVGLFVDPADALLDAILGQVRLDYVQLHGSETPDRFDAIRLEYGVPSIKALGVADESDVRSGDRFVGHADRLLFDAKPPPEADRPGGNAEAFNWPLMKGYSGVLPWFLAGGLTPDTVAKAIAQSGAEAVDVSSGVESAPGQKDPALIQAFLEAAKAG